MRGDGSDPEAAGEAPSSDGRKRRRQESARRLVEALAATVTEADGEVTPEQIAAKSGYSVSTIFRHFGGRDGLIAAMRELLQSRVREHVDAGPFEGDVHARVRELVRRLAAAFETATPFLRFVASDRRRAYLLPPGRRFLDGIVRDQIRLAFADEFARLPADTVDMLAAVLTVDAWSHMRTIQGHSSERAAALMEMTLVRLLGVDSPRRR